MRTRRVLGALVAALVVLVGASPAWARTNNRSKPIMFVHGLDAFGCAGTDGNATWNDMITALQGWGWSSTMAKFSYYECDVNYNYSVNHHGSHSTHYGGSGEHVTLGDGSLSHNADTQIEHIAFHWAWAVYDHFSKAGTVVDAVGHSMGGLIIRYAIAQVQRDHASFPPLLYVEDVVTFGTPHTGTAWALGCGWADQCDEMVGGSAFMNWLANNAQNPQADGGRDWTVIVADDDTVVSVSSGMGMDAEHKTRYLGSNNIEHSDYMHRTTDARTADVEYWDRPGPWFSWYDAPWPVRWSDFSMVYGTW